MNSASLKALITHALHVPHKLAQKKGQKIISDEDTFRLFLQVWKMKGRNFLKQLIKLKLSFINPFAFRKFLFVFVTHNQYLALLPIFERLRSESSSIKNGYNIDKEFIGGAMLPYLYIYLLDFMIFPFFYFYFRKYLFSNYGGDIRREYMLTFSSQAVSVHYIFRFLFWLWKPGYLIMANDHSHINVAILHAARRHKIRTVYFQHANISEVFPPMSFDYAFLYSHLSAEIYTAISPTETIMFCVGNMKADRYLNINRDRDFDSANLHIVLSVNMVSELDVYMELALRLVEMENVKLVKFRTHPAMEKVTLDFEHPKIVYSDAKSEISFECFRGIDLHVAGNSSIIEEALFTDTPTLYLDLDDNLSDYYGYMKRGVVVDRFVDIENVLGFVKKYAYKISVIDRASLYSSSLNSSYSGRTVELVADIFGRIDNGEVSKAAIFEKVPGLESERVFRVVR